MGPSCCGHQVDNLSASRRHTMLSRRDRKSQSLTIARYGQPQGGAYKTLITFGVQQYTAIIAGGLMHIS
jgi:hypothetical protein